MSRSMYPRVLLLMLSLAVLFGAPAHAGGPGPGVSVLRVGLFTNVTNLNLVVLDPATGAVTGVGGEVARALAADLGVPLVPIGYPTFREIFAASGADEWDVTFMGVGPTTEAGLSFSRPYLLIHQTYAVRADATFRGIADLDTPGTRIVVNQGNPSDLFLSRALQNAELTRVDSPGRAVEAVVSGEADAFATARQLLTDIVDQTPGLRLVDDNFTSSETVVGVAPGREGLLLRINTVVGRAIASGLVERAIAQNQVQGVSVPN